MPWYVSYRSGISVVMSVYRRKEWAISAARRLLATGRGNGIKVGPMLGPPEGNTLNADDLRRLDYGE